jgi:hypothetical protein
VNGGARPRAQRNDAGPHPAEWPLVAVDPRALALGT